MAIKHADGTMDFNPASEATMGAGDQLVVLGRSELAMLLEETTTV